MSETQADKATVLADVQREIKSINAFAKIIPAVRCQVDLEEVLNCRAYDIKVARALSVLLSRRGMRGCLSRWNSEVLPV